MILEYLDLFLNIEHFENVLLNLTENMAFSPIFVRMLSLYLWNRELGELIKEAKKDFNAESYSDDEVETFVPYHVKSKLFMKLLMSNTALTATSFYLKPLLSQMDAGKCKKFLLKKGSIWLSQSLIK